MLAACGDPLAKVDKLSSVDLPEDASMVEALPDPARSGAPKGLFAGLFGGAEKTTPTAASAPLATDDAVSAALSDVEAQVTTPAAPAAPVREKRGLFGLLKAKEAPQSAPASATQLAEAPALAVEPEKVAAVTEAVPEPQAKPRKGLFGLLAGARAKNDATRAPEATVRTASLGPAVTSVPDEKKKPAFGNRTAKHKGPDVQVVPFGLTLPSGAIARVCDLPSGRLGKEIGKFPERGRGYKMFDSNPSAAGARPFYVTGFDDKCARTFTAALALFGSPTMHEQLRYGLPSSVQPYSTTDKAYEGIKRSVCGVSKKKPCGAKIKQLEKDTVFISIYDRIGSNSSWSNVLLHNGWVLAADRKG